MLRKAKTAAVSSPQFSALKSSIKPLLGMQCYVDAKNEDGIDVSSIFSGILVELGAQIAESFGENCQVLVYSNGESKRLKAAAAFDVPVVSTLWVEQCRESNSKASCDDFLITAATASISNVKENKVMEPVIDQVSKLRNIDSPFFSSSQRVEDNIKGKEKVKRQPLKSVNTNAVNPKMPVIVEEKERKRPFIALVDSDDENDNDTPTSAPSASVETAKTEDISPAVDATEKKFEETFDSSVNDPFESLRPSNFQGKSKKNDKKVSKTSKVVSQVVEPVASTVSKSLEKPDSKKKKANSTETTEVTKCSNIAVAVSGFDNTVNDGEKETLQYILQEFLATINTSKKSSKDYTKACYIDNQNSKVDAYCSHIIAHSSSNKRSLRILFALANGSPIVTESWLYSCIEKSHWVPVTSEYRHSRYNKHKIDGQKLLLFNNSTIFIGESINPTVAVLEKLIKLIGGCVTKSIDDADYVVFSDSNVAANWLHSNALDGRKLYNKQGCLVVNTKYIFDCIESNKVLSADNKEYKVELDFSEFEVLVESEVTVGKKKVAKKTHVKDSTPTVAATPTIPANSVKKGKRKLPINESVTGNQSNKKKSPVSNVSTESQNSTTKKLSPPVVNTASSKKDSPPQDVEESPQLLLPKKSTPASSSRIQRLQDTYKDDDDEIWSETKEMQAPSSTRYVPSQESFNYTAKSDTEDNGREESPAW